MNRIRDGLNEWHHAFCRALAMKLLSYGPITNALTQTVHGNLTWFLARYCDIPQKKIAGVLDILAVTRTASGVSRHHSFNGVSTEVSINFGGLEAYQAGGEFEEYASYAADPVIGSRWVQNVDEAILLTFAHEFAHYLVALKHPHEAVRPHGAEFQQMYGLIRRYAVNPMLDEFAMNEVQRAAAQFEMRLIRKIQALRKMAEDPTSNENEAERAVVQLQALMAKHGLTEGSLSGEEKPHVVERIVPLVRRDNYKPLMHVCWSIARFCGVEAVIHTGRLSSPADKPGRALLQWSHEYLAYFGAPSDAEMAVYLSDLIFHSLYEESARYRASETYRTDLAAGHHSRTLVSSFRRAFVARISRRLRQSRTAVENAWVTSRVDGRALMAQKDARLQALFKARYPRLLQLRESHSSADRVSSAESAGRSAADRVNLNRPVGHARPRALEHLS